MLEVGRLQRSLHHDARMKPRDTTRCVRVKKETQCDTNEYCSHVVGVGDSVLVPHCNWVRRYGVDTAFRLEELRFLLAEGHPLDGGLGGHHLPHEGSKE